MIKIPENIKYVIETLTNNNFEAYIVGGCVRDMLMGKKPDDYDITTSATPQEVINLFEKTVPTGIKHGTVTVIIDNKNVEVTTFRADGEYNDSRHPNNVEFVKSLKQDLARRDFTVNAMAFNDKVGLVDFFGGRDDINKGILRTVGNPKARFSEDALRILRLFRFASVLNFDIEKDTLNSALTLCKTLENISCERIFTELKKAIKGKNPKAIAPLINSGGLKFLNINEFTKFDILKISSHNENLCIFSFLYFSSLNVLETLSILKSDNNLKSYCNYMLKLINKPLPKNKFELKELLSVFPLEIVKDYFTLRNLVFDENPINAELMLEEIFEKNEPYLISHLKINGNDLKNLNVKDTEIGLKLETLRKLVSENPEKNEKEILIEFIKIH